MLTGAAAACIKRPRCAGWEAICSQLAARYPHTVCAMHVCRQDRLPHVHHPLRGVLCAVPRWVPWCPLRGGLGKCSCMAGCAAPATCAACRLAGSSLARQELTGNAVHLALHPPSSCADANEIRVRRTPEAGVRSGQSSSQQACPNTCPKPNTCSRRPARQGPA